MSSAGQTIALIVAAGSGSRSGLGVPKQYVHVAGKTVLAHAIDHLAAHPDVDAIRVVIGPGQEQLYKDAIGGRVLGLPVIGGEARRDSVRNGLDALVLEGNVERVLIHDAARPFTPATVIDRLLAALDEHDGAVPVLPVADTLVRGDDLVGDTVERAGLHRVQTPQAFRLDRVLAAHEAWPNANEATDDAQMVRRIGGRVALVAGDTRLEKLTYPEDFAAAEARLVRPRMPRTGMGFDVHAFEDGDGVWLGGVRIAHGKGLKGHSDADVALHALTDALLGTVGAGDIGDHFPPSDPQWKGAPSPLFLEHARDVVVAAGGRIEHVDLTIICEAPKIGPHRDAIRTRIADLLRLGLTQVSVKATTTERLGFTGRGEGIAAQAIATVTLEATSS